MAHQARSIKPNNFNCQLYATYPDTISYAAKVSGVDTAYVGPFAARRVMNGDSIALKAESYYRTHDNNASLQPALTPAQSQANLLKQVAYGLSNAGQGLTAAELLADTALQNSVTNYLAGLTVAAGRPQAGVYWLSLDQQLRYIAAGSGFAQVGSGGCGIINPVIPKATSNGYLFILVANQTPQLFVYYDNLQMAHVHSPVLEETSYYPFGLAMKGISSQASGSLENKIKFQKQELQSNEFSDGSGLDMYEFKYRFDDPQTGRFWSIDPLAEKYVYNSTYAFSENKVTSHVELEGLESVSMNTDFMKDMSQQQRSQFWNGYLTGQQETAGKGIVAGAFVGFAIFGILNPEVGIPVAVSYLSGVPVNGVPTSTVETTVETTAETALHPLQQRAIDLNNLNPNQVAQNMRVTAVANGTNQAGEEVTMVASSRSNLSRVQRAALNPNETVVTNKSLGVKSTINIDAEQKIAQFAKLNNIVPGEIGASKPICASCADVLNRAGFVPISPLKVYSDATRAAVKPITVFPTTPTH